MPAGHSRAEALLDEIGELLAIIMRVSRRLDQPGVAMTTTQRLALMEVARVGPLRLASLASRMDTTPATASRAVDALEELELAERRSDPHDGRAVQIAATRRGRRWAEERRRLLLSLLDEVGCATSSQVTQELSELNAALRAATGHDEVARGELLAP